MMLSWVKIGAAALVAVIFAFTKAWFSGAKAERIANQAKEAEANAKVLRDINDAHTARAAVGTSYGLPDDDKYRRD